MITAYLIAMAGLAVAACAGYGFAGTCPRRRRAIRRHAGSMFTRTGY